jgi:myosin heavy subunit
MEYYRSGSLENYARVMVPSSNLNNIRRAIQMSSNSEHELPQSEEDKSSSPTGEHELPQSEEDESSSPTKPESAELETGPCESFVLDRGCEQNQESSPIVHDSPCNAESLSIPALHKLIRRAANKNDIEALERLHKQLQDQIRLLPIEELRSPPIKPLEDMDNVTQMVVDVINEGVARAWQEVQNIRRYVDKVVGLLATHNGDLHWCRERCTCGAYEKGLQSLRSDKLNKINLSHRMQLAKEEHRRTIAKERNEDAKKKKMAEEAEKMAEEANKLKAEKKKAKKERKARKREIEQQNKEKEEEAEKEKEQQAEKDTENEASTSSEEAKKLKAEKKKERKERKARKREIEQQNKEKEEQAEKEKEQQGEKDTENEASKSSGTSSGIPIPVCASTPIRVQSSSTFEVSAIVHSIPAEHSSDFAAPSASAEESNSSAQLSAKAVKKKNHTQHRTSLRSESMDENEDQDKFKTPKVPRLTLKVLPVRSADSPPQIVFQKKHRVNNTWMTLDHTSSSKVLCRLCKREEKLRGYTMHFRRHHTEALIQCPHCTQTMKLQADMDRHIARHQMK